MTTRREFIKWTAAGGAGLAAGRGLLSGRARAAASRAPAVWARGASVASSLTPYLDPMPVLVDNAVDATGGGTVKLWDGAGGRPRGRGTQVRVRARGAGRQAGGRERTWSRARSAQAQRYAAQCDRRPSRKSTSISPGLKGPTTPAGFACRGQAAGKRCPLIPRRAVAGGEALRGGDCADGTPDEFTRDRPPGPSSRAVGRARQPDTRAIPSAGPHRAAGDRLRDGRVLAG